MVERTTFSKQQNFNSDKYGPTTFNNVEFGEARGFLASKDKRYLLDGRFSINVVDSAKFGKEVHFQVYTDGGFVRETRNNSKWNRIEIYCALEKLDKLIESLQKVKENIENANVDARPNTAM